MDVVISHESALSYLDLCARKKSPVGFSGSPIPYPGGLPYECACRRQDLDLFAFDRFNREGKAVDLLVPDKSCIRKVYGFAQHSAGGRLPDGALLDAGGGALVCSAPMLFVQLSQGKKLIDCIRLGFYLCATYSLEPSSPTGTVKRTPLACREELEAFVGDAWHLRGSRNAEAAIPWVLDGSASPMETELALKFFLPGSLGGYCFAAPSMNYEIVLSSRGSRILKKNSVRIDVYWPEQKIGFEYDSEASHGTAEKHGDDQARALVLNTMGIHIVSVTKKQVDDPRQLEILAGILREYGVPRVEEPKTLFPKRCR